MYNIKSHKNLDNKGSTIFRSPHEMCIIDGRFKYLFLTRSQKCCQVISGCKLQQHISELVFFFKKWVKSMNMCSRGSFKKFLFKNKSSDFQWRRTIVVKNWKFWSFNTALIRKKTAVTFSEKKILWFGSRWKNKNFLIQIWFTTYHVAQRI